MSIPQSWLLDSCFVLYLGSKTSQFHSVASEWVDAHKGDTFYLCSVTEGALLRILPKKQTANALQKAWLTLRDIYVLDGFVFLNVPDLSYGDVSNLGLHGVKQITDAWLAQLARRENMRVATFDNGFVAQHPDVAVLIQ